MKQYLDGLRTILEKGVQRGDRTGTGTIDHFGYQMRFDLSEGFPLLTTKKVFTRGIIEELLWFLRGETNIQPLLDKNVHIWDGWATEDGDLGPVYGKQWRLWDAFRFEFPGLTHKGKYKKHPIDQIAQVIEQIRTNPNSRRHIVSAWNPADLPDESISPQENVANGKMALAPCHLVFQFHVADGKLSCQLYQRSSDAFLGVPFNIASYALLTMMVAQVCDLEPGEFVHTFGSFHIYNNHMDQVKEQLSREPRDLPVMRINPKVKEIDDFTIDDFELIGYNPHPTIKAPISV